MAGSSFCKASAAGERPVLKAKDSGGGDLLGILQQDPRPGCRGGVAAGAISADAMEALVAERTQAKLAKNYARADERSGRNYWPRASSGGLPGEEQWRRGERSARPAQVAPLQGGWLRLARALFG